VHKFILLARYAAYWIDSVLGKISSWRTGGWHWPWSIFAWDN